MEKQLKKVRGVAQRILNFSANTKKIGREKLLTAQGGLRIQLLQDYWGEYVREHFELVDIATDEFKESSKYFSDDEYFDMEQMYQEAVGELQALTGSGPDQVRQGVTTRAMPPVAAIKPIAPPTFSGDVTTWASFRDLFSSLINHNPSLSNVQRLHYLKAACKGEAEEILRDIQVTEANFTVAWEVLRKRFENNRVIVSKLVEKLLTLPYMTTDSADELKHLLDGANHALRALNALQRPTDSWDDLLVVHLASRLDVKTRQVWERRNSASTDMPTYEQLSECLEGELRSLEAMKDASSGGMVTASTKKKVVRTHLVETKSECVMCKGAHGLYACEGFIALPVEDRRSLITRSKLCFNCISTDKHISKGCKSKYLCKVCQRKHHTLLHQDGENAANDHASVAVHMIKQPQFNVLLATALVKIQGPHGSLYARALIDPGSHVSLVTESVVQQLQVARSKTNITVSGVGAASTGDCNGCVTIKVVSRLNDVGLSVTALILKRITSELPSMRAETTTWPHIQGLTLADAGFGDPGPIDVLLGADVYRSLLLEGVRKGAHGPLAQQTIFGWVLSGHATTSIAEKPPVVSSLHVCLEVQLRKFWELEEVDLDRTQSIEDSICEKHFNDTVQRGGDGRYTLHLPFKTTKRQLGESRATAVQRLLHMERRYAKKPELFQQYQAFMDAYADLGHMECVNPSELHASIKPVYLPHHSIHKPSSTSTKVRVVFDASQATSSGHSLNDVLMTGPRLQDDLSAILMRWRKVKIALSADVQKMYRQFWVAEEHRDYQRIVWRRTPHEPIADYRLKTITYGTSSAPYMAVRAMQRLAEDECHRFPIAAEIVKRDFYMDDVLTGADSVDAAIRLKDELMGLMRSGGLPLLKWSSNNAEVLHTLPEDHRECRASLDIDNDDTIKTLGVYWHPATDQFGFRVTSGDMDGVVTKRKVLSAIAKIFDPLSLLAPVIVTAKMLMQQLWLVGSGWDEEVPGEVRKAWLDYREQLPCIESIRVDRWMGMQPGDQLEIHGFSDASKNAYAACVYLRVQRCDGVRVVLVAAKTKVAPIKQVSVPRLELNGALLLSKLLGAVQKALLLPPQTSVSAWTDSTVVLAWLQGHANRWPTYVANRVSQIQSAMEVSGWRHIPGTDNPADVASRGIGPAALAAHPLWWSGPSWLLKDEQHWPERKDVSVDRSLLQEKVQTCAVTSRTVWDLVQRYSSLDRLLRITCYCIRACQRVKRPSIGIEADELQGALLVWIRHVQEVEFGDEMRCTQQKEGNQAGKLKGLQPFVDDLGLLRVGGRLQNLSGTYDEKHPFILPRRGHFTQLVIAHAHEKVMHFGPKQTIGQLQHRFWVLGVRNAVKAYIRRCVTCFRAKPLTQQQLMGQLPAARITPSRAFLHTAIDYAGPIWTRTAKGRGHKANKAWIAVFICLASKAIHLELVSDLSTEGFIAAFRRFSARRGHCSNIYCDNGTNFVGAAGELGRLLQSCVKDPEWHREISEDGSQFHFAPPGSPHFNGLAESAVKLAKTALRKVVGEHTLTFEEMTTFLSQAEAVLNSRPLGTLTRDPEDIAPLTPGHFLIGQPLIAVPEPNRLNEKETYGNRWKLVQRLAQQFWSRWSAEYVHAMQQRGRWQTAKRSVAVGDVVILRDELLPATKWKLGRIQAVHPGEDGHVRVVTIRSGSSTLKRSVVKICVLPILDNSCDADEEQIGDENE